MDQQNNNQQVTQQPTYQQPTYQQPVYQQPVYQQNYNFTPIDTAKHGKGGGWIGFMRVMAWILFALVEIVVIVAGISMMASANTYWGFNVGLVFGGLGVIVGGTLAAFIMIAGTMILLDAAKNIQRTTTTTAELLYKVEQIEKKMK